MAAENATPASTTPAPNGAPPPAPNGQPPAAAPKGDGAGGEPPNEPAGPTSAAFAALARKERAALERERAIKAEREAFAKEREAFTTEAQKLRTAQKLLSDGQALEALEALGVDYATLTKAALKKPGEAKASKEVDELRTKLAEFEKWKSTLEEESQTATQRAQIEHVQSVLVQTAKAKADEHKVFAAHGDDALHAAYLEMVEHAQTTLQATGTAQILPPEEAIKRVDGYLTEGIKQTLALARQLGITLDDAGDEKQKSSSSDKAKPPDRNPGNGASKTLTNQDAATPPPGGPPKPRTRIEVERERLRRAERVLTG